MRDSKIQCPGWKTYDKRVIACLGAMVKTKFHIRKCLGTNYDVLREEKHIVICVHALDNIFSSSLDFACASANVHFSDRYFTESGPTILSMV